MFRRIVNQQVNVRSAVSTLAGQNALHARRAMRPTLMQFTQPTTAQSAPLVLSRHFSLKPSNTDMDESKFSVRTFKDGTKAIELVEQHTEAAEATFGKETKHTVAPFTTFNFIRTV